MSVRTCKLSNLSLIFLPDPKFYPYSRSKPLANECSDICKAENNECKSTCSSISACYECDTEMLKCIEACPCRDQCPDGCNGCQNPIYPPERTEVLILSTFQAASVPILINSAAGADKDFFFDIDEEAQVYESCSLTWQNELYVFGGNSKKTQISRVTSCRLEPVGQLKFDHYLGDCVNVYNKVILCFNYANGDYKKCRMASSPTGTFFEMAPSQYDHGRTRIATDDGEFIQMSIQSIIFLL